MCGRYLTPDQAALERHWNLQAPADYFQSYNVAPSQLAPVVRANLEGQWEIGMITWGFQPVWAERPWINARSETVFTTKAFASAAKKRRCLVPAMGWYEWQRGAAPRRPYVFHLAGFAPFAFAGIWTARKIDGQWVRSFAILTTEATGPLRDVHHRKPVVLGREKYDSWLGSGTGPNDAMTALAGDLADIAAYPVSTYVNQPAHDDPECIKPITP